MSQLKGVRHPLVSALLSGIVWGIGFIMTIFAFYHFSGLRGAVTKVLGTLEEVRPAGEAAFSFLKVAGKGYSFASNLVDKGVNAITPTKDAGEEVRKVTGRTLADFFTGKALPNQT
ncbi:hypothetical protein EST38_g2510 [Candolleomyces aberdarensis]|uniref:Uncharacterized protein n=1 Tax=Candolleomyces aberdarensis TaxID=2316362 RepID=A0A4Q2DVE1_9AGAR|nr:hypothetical protein EST38_g2510 [Candolleomyces aberdarensis]